MHPKDVDGKANSVNPDLDMDFCSHLSVPILKVFMIPVHSLIVSQFLGKLISVLE